MIFMTSVKFKDNQLNGHFLVCNKCIWTKISAILSFQKTFFTKGETIQNQTEPVFSASEASLEISSQ